MENRSSAPILHEMGRPVKPLSPRPQAAQPPPEAAQPRPKSADLPVLPHRVNANHYTVTSGSDVWTVYEVRRAAAQAGRDEPWVCECDGYRFRRCCRHVTEVEKAEARRSEPVRLPTPAQLASAALEESGIVPFPISPATGPVRLCERCGEPAHPHYTNPDLCRRCGFQAGFQP